MNAVPYFILYEEDILKISDEAKISGKRMAIVALEHTTDDPEITSNVRIHIRNELDRRDQCKTTPRTQINEIPDKAVNNPKKNILHDYRNPGNMSNHNNLLTDVAESEHNMNHVKHTCDGENIVQAMTVKNPLGVPEIEVANMLRVNKNKITIIVIDKPAAEINFTNDSDLADHDASADITLTNITATDIADHTIGNMTDEIPSVQPSFGISGRTNDVELKQYMAKAKDTITYQHVMKFHE